MPSFACMLMRVAAVEAAWDRTRHRSAETDIQRDLSRGTIREAEELTEARQAERQTGGMLLWKQRGESPWALDHAASSDELLIREYVQNVLPACDLPAMFSQSPPLSQPHFIWHGPEPQALHANTRHAVERERKKR